MLATLPDQRNTPAPRDTLGWLCLAPIAAHDRASSCARDWLSLASSGARRHPATSTRQRPIKSSSRDDADDLFRLGMR
jgi:hypothetical protein